MATFIMLVIAIHGYGSRPVIYTQEFNTEKACWVAVNEIRASYKEAGEPLRKAICVPKG